MSNKRVLIVEDEKAILDIIAFNLRREGYETMAATTGTEGLRLAVSQSPDLVLLDVMLPEMDGFSVLDAIRKTSEMPVIMLTAREEESDKVMGLELGADDYITKPFSMRELLARVKANMRRSALAESVQEQKNADFSYMGLAIDFGRREVYKNEKAVDLTVREYELLTFLASAPGRAFSREELMEKVWGYEFYGDLRAVDVAVRRLRGKIEDHDAEPVYIGTRRGVGYFFGTG